MYAKIDPSSTDCASNALDLFHVPGTNVGVLHVQFKEFLTLNPVNSAPYVFVIPSSNQLIDLSLTTLETHWTMQISHDAGVTWVNVVAADNFSVIQMFGATWKRNVVLRANQKEIYNSNNLHAYKTIFDTMLSYGLEAKKTHMVVSGIFMIKAMFKI